MSSPPSTPSRPTRVLHYGHQPATSSPLASSDGSSPLSSPGVPSYARRRSQYKSNEPQLFSSPSTSRKRSQGQRRHVALGGDLFHPVPAESSSSVTAPTEEAPRKAFLRERFKARCLERAQKDRERKIRGRRGAISEPSSEGDDEMIDDAEGEEEMINDELFHRLVASGKRKEQHAYRVSYQRDVGSSFDPVLVEEADAAEWEHEDVQEPTPYDLEEEELAEYAAEYELHLEDINADEFFTYSDIDDSPVGHSAEDDDVEMVM
ncbi:hypothetical protein C8Q72DRAFT_788826 [Fomitopsis betulina]|nr:hypothetical protein C8Q72DRAFT_788826 [Fomitopsis betulina]